MKLNDEEQDILAGKAGPVPQEALKHQIKVGNFFDAPLLDIALNFSPFDPFRLAG